MIICSCHGVTENELRKACQTGRVEACRAGTACGGCLATVAAVVEEARRGVLDPAAQGRHERSNGLRARESS